MVIQAKRKEEILKRRNIAAESEITLLTDENAEVHTVYNKTFKGKTFMVFRCCLGVANTNYIEIDINIEIQIIVLIIVHT